MSESSCADARSPAVAQPHEVAPAGGEVEREVAVGLEDPEPSHPVARHARGGHVGHHAALELDPRIGHVEVLREHRDARGAHVDGLGAAGEVQDQVEVVDHEVEHHGDVGAAGLEGGEALALEVQRMVQQRLGGAQRLVEALDVSHLQLHALARRLGDQRVGLRARVAASGFSMSIGTPRRSTRRPTSCVVLASGRPR